jgi:hypothetical protein
MQTTKYTPQEEQALMSRLWSAKLRDDRVGDRILDLEPHPDGGPRGPPRASRRVGGIALHEPFEVRDVVFVEGQIDGESFDGEPAEIAGGEEHGKQSVATLDPADRDRRPAAVAGHHRDAVEHQRAGPAQFHRLEPHIRLEFRDRPGHDPTEPLRL